MAAVSAGGISEAISKASVSAREAGMSIDELIASVSVIGETTQQSMDSVGNAMKTLLARYGNVKAGVFTSMGLNDDGDTSENINDIEKVLSKLGIRMRSSATEIRSITDVLDEVAEKWDTLDDVSRGALGTAFAGTRQREQFNILMSQWDRVKELTEESANAAGTADEKYTAYMDSMEAATKRLQNAWEGFTQSLEVSPVMKLLTNTTTFLVENADKLKYLATLIAAASSTKIFDFITNKGETGGWKGLVANIPFIGRGAKTNNVLESIDKKVGNIEKGVGANSIANQTKNGGFFKGVGDFFKIGFGRGDIYDPETGKSISYREAKAYSKLLKSTTGGTALTDPQMNQYAELLQQREIGNAAMGATSAVLTNLFTTKQVGGSGIGKLLNPTDQTVEETAGDKVGRTLASGVLAAAGGYFLGPLGAMLGQIVGEGAASIVSTLVHRSELEMKQRVADAKENLQRLDGIKSSLDENSSVMTEVTSSEAFEKLYKYTDDLYDKLFELQYEGDVDIIGAINNASKTFKGVENITSVRDLCDEINNGNADQRSMIKRQLELAEARINLEELSKSQEESRTKVAETLSTKFEFAFEPIPNNTETTKQASSLKQEMQELPGLFYSKRSNTDYFKLKDGLSPEEIEDTLEKVLSIYDKGLENGIISSETYEKITQKINNYMPSIKKAASTLSSLDRELIEARSNIGFLVADIHDLTTTELKDLTMDGVVGRVVEALEAQGVEVRNAAGYIKDEYQDAIEKLIKTDSKFNALQQVDTKTLGQLTSAQERFSSMLEEQAELVKEYGKSWDEWYDAAKRGKLSEEIAEIVYAANPERIEQFARAWNTTREGLERLTKEFPDLTNAIGLMSPSEVREYYSAFSDFFDDMADGSALTAANLEKIINYYPQLLKYYKQGNEAFSGELLQKFNNEQLIGYVNSIFSEEMSSQGIGSEFMMSLKETPQDFGDLWSATSKGFLAKEQGEGNFMSITYDELMKEIGGVKTLNEALEKAVKLKQSDNENDQRKGELIEALVKAYMDYDRVIEWVDPLYKKAKQAEIDYLTDQINNLEEQKDALSSVNDERQRELDLIKAKDALENAKKQKKRVYREGVGWTYESDEAAISSAKENLENLDIQRQQESLQYQIDQTNLLKDILEGLDEEKQKKANKEALEEYFGKDLSNLANPQLIEKLVEGFDNNNFKFNSTTGEIKNAKGEVIGKVDGVEGVGDLEAEQINAAKTALVGGKDAGGNDIAGAFEDFKEARKEFEGISSDKIGTEEYRTAAAKYHNAKEKLETKLSEAKSVGVDKETIEEGSSLLKSYQEPKKTDWILVNNLTNPDSSLLGNNVASGTHNVMLTTKEMADTDQFKKSKYTAVKTYNPLTGGWSDWEKIDGSISGLPDNSIVMNSDYKDAYAWVKNGQLYWIADASGNIKKEFTWHKDWATGTLSTPVASSSLINELGTEAIITPSGTVTALPAKTGIVPADITKNLWSLGEVAPTLVAQLGSLNQKTISGTPANTTYEEGQYFDNFTMNVYPTKDYDMDKLLMEARAKFNLTKHNN